MPDYWPHLNNIRDSRGKTYADIIKSDVKDSIIVDLNCGKAPIFNYIDNYKYYYGNDLQPEFITELTDLAKGKSALFELKSDKDVKLEKIDVLMLLGCGAQTLHSGPSPESNSDFLSLMRLISENNPKIVVLEFVQEVYTRVLNSVIEQIKDMGYNIDIELNTTFGNGSFMRRVLWKLRRK